MADIKVTNSTPVGAPVAGTPIQGTTGAATLIQPQKPQVKVTDGIRPQPPAPPAPVPAPKKPSSSPWDDDAPEPPVAKAPTIIGTLHDQEALELPKNVVETVGQKIPATAFVGNQAEKEAAAMTQGGKPEDWDWFGSGEQPKNQSLAAPSTQKIDLGSAQAAPQPYLSLAQSQTPAPLTAAVPALSAQVVVPPSQPITAPGPAKFGGPFSIFTNFFRRKAILPAPAIPQAPTIPVAKSGSRLKVGIFVVMGVFLLFVILTAMTEMGVISLSLEKAYGAVGLQNLWKGLPPNAEGALAYSFAATKNHANYKVKGTMNLRIDSSVKSEVISPLISMTSQNQYVTRDQDAGAAISATKTVSDSYVITDPSIGATANSASPAAPTSDSGVPSTSTSTSTAATASNNNAASGQAPEKSTSASTVSNVDTNVALKATSSGTQAKISFKKAGTDEEVDLVSMGQNLFVKGTTDINFGSTDPAEFVRYKIQSLEDKSISRDIFDIKNNSGLSIKGVRTGNEIAGGVRCFKYRIDGVELGSALSGIGITSDYVQTATGQIWIGVKDKTIRRAQLKITTPISSAVTMIEVDLQFYDYDVINKLDYQNEITSAVAPVAPTVMATLSGDTKRKADVDAILSALLQYKAVTGSYPVSSELLKLSVSGNIIETALVPKYLASLPSDPMASWYYAYKSSNGQQCSLSSRLESSSDASGQLVNGTYLYLKYSN